MNMFKSNGGFTLVELIVVIAILAILAGIAVPAYSGYIKKAQTAADVQVLSTINTAAQGLAAGQGATVDKIEVTAEGAATVTLTSDSPEGSSVASAEIAELVPNPSFTDGFDGATWEDGEWDIDYTTED